MGSQEMALSRVCPAHEVLSEVDFRFVWDVFFFFNILTIYSLKNVVPLGYWWIEQNSQFLHESFSKLFRYTIKPFTCGFFFSKVNGRTYPALNIFSKCKTTTKQKPLKLWIFKSSFKQPNHIYTSIQTRWGTDNFSASTMSYSNFLIYFDSL